jgi:YegS/Rv2252/BmrU family lipid kinase
MKKIKIILNPVAGKGHSGRVESDIIRYFKEENAEFDLIRTRHRGHGIELARRAVEDGFEVVVAVGGDGTTNEVVNGLMSARSGEVAGTLGLLPTGSASDFTYSVGIPTDLKEACLLITRGKTRIVDLGQVTLPDNETRYFDNQLGIGFDGVVTIEAQKFKWLRGMALYLPVVLKTVFLSNKPTRIKIDCDGRIIEESTLQLTVANGIREGGGFLMAPEAKIDDGYLDICLIRAISKMAMLGIIPKFMNGTHVQHRAATTTRGKVLTITSDDNLIAHIDGEMLCTQGHRIEARIIPQCLEVLH